MSDRKISRREFVQSSIAGGVAAGRAWAKPSPDTSASLSPPDPTGISLLVVGNPQEGYSVKILFNAHPLAYFESQGEFSAIFQNGERSLEDRVAHWKGASWTGTPSHVTLHGTCKLPRLNTTVFAEVEYEVISPQIIRKRIRFHQVDMYMLYYQVSHRLMPEESPSKFWSFDQADCRGGALHEYFPAAGFRTVAGETVGLLTDAGFRNHWSRLIRRDGKPVKPAPERIPDTNLNYVPRANDRAAGSRYVQQTFGEVLAWSANGPGETLALPPPSAWQRRGKATVEERDGVTVLTAQRDEDKLVIPFSARASSVYSIRLRYRAIQPFAVDIWDADAQLRKIENITLYNDLVPASSSSWADFQTTVFFYSSLENAGALVISPPQSEQALTLEGAARRGEIELQELQLCRMKTHYEPYHRLAMDHPDEKTSFIFVDEHAPDTLRGYRLASQLHLAAALGFQGGETEKVLYADLAMLSWIAGPQYFSPMIAPSIWYSAAGEMYLRDSFFACNGVHNRALNEGVFNLWAANQGLNGAINTLVEPSMANLEHKSNDSTPLWLMWALQNRRRFGTEIPTDKVRRAAEYCLRTYDRNHDGTCWAQFVMGQLDVIDFPQGVTDICENQGMLALTLRVIKELDVPGVSDRVSESYIRQVEEGYRSYYDPARKHLRPARHIADAVGFDEIFPEFLSLWLFNRKILTDEMMRNHLDCIPVLLPRPNAPYPEAGGTARPIFIGLTEGGKGWSYFTDTWHPMISQEHGAGYANHQMDGIYYNGGSWMRIEICGYVAGKLHGWKKAEQAIANRLWAELNISPEFPTSQEYLATNPTHPFFGYHRVFAWNAFVLQVLELAGLRQSSMDPNFTPR